MVQPRKRTLTSNYNVEPLNILVVDDNRYMQRVVETILRAMRIRNFRSVFSPIEAFMQLRQWEADIVITDWAMEPLDGIDFTRLIRMSKDSPTPYVPIILLTGHTEMYRVKEARDAGVTEILAKPVSIEGLFSRIIHIIDKPRPFVRTATYFGPDRRRRADPSYTGPERRNANQASEAAPPVALVKKEEDVDGG